MHSDLLHFRDWTSEQASKLLAFALDLKNNPDKYGKPLSGKSIVAIFEKPSLRTRVTFDIGINKLGGHMVYVDSQGEPLKKREAPIDVGANIAQWADGIVSRVFEHQTLEEMAAGADIPVVNALCDRYHPCQALADYITITEADGDLRGKTLTYVGDGNNVTHSLLILGILLGVNQKVITPKGHEIDSEIADFVKNKASEMSVTVEFSNNLEDAANSDYIYTDTWLSMGDNTPLSQIKDKFMAYQVNDDLMQSSGARFVLHCQPAHRDLEISGQLMDSEKSLLMQEAGNRLHAQNAILTYLLTNLSLDSF
ncbi:ornithine carbamoyltransferase [Glaciecola sp. 1036]|uniref:ornithine carbamoyltransferase n=1 Tax=Alteromonadaceae TaxID=72275 RepID=UPI003D01CDA8